MKKNSTTLNNRDNKFCGLKLISFTQEKPVETYQLDIWAIKNLWITWSPNFIF